MNHSICCLTQYFSVKQPNGVSQIIRMVLEKIIWMIRRVKAMSSACAIMNVVIASMTVNVIDCNPKILSIMKLVKGTDFMDYSLA